MDRPEVRGNKTCESPFFLQNRIEQADVFAVERAVNLGIGAHHGSGVAQLDGILERGKINLAQGALANFFVNCRPVGLLVVRDVVLHVRHDAPALHSVDEGNRQLPGEKRILPVSLEGAAILRYAHDVDRRRFEQRISQVARFAAGNGAIFHGKVTVPGAGQRDRRGQRRGRPRRLNSSGTCARGAVGNAQVGNAQPGDPENDSIMGSIAEAVQLLDLFVQRHARNNFSGAFIGGLRMP